MISMQYSLKTDAQKVLESYSKLESYCIQEEILQCLLKRFPDHKKYAAVETKAKLLNLFYSTSINAIALMSRHIFEIKKIDERLDKGDKKLVADIANLVFPDGKERNNYSFATKYCAYHQPTRYPIFDRIVESVFISLFKNNKLDGYKYTRTNINTSRAFSISAFKERLKDYTFYVQIYDSFMKQYDLQSFTYRQVDSYLWGAYKISGQEFQIEKLAPIDKSNIIEV